MAVWPPGHGPLARGLPIQTEQLPQLVLSSGTGAVDLVTQDQHLQVGGGEAGGGKEKQEVRD